MPRRLACAALRSGVSIGAMLGLWRYAGDWRDGAIAAGLLMGEG